MDNLAKLRRQKAELKARIEQERNDLKNTILEIRAEMEPANLLKKTVGGLLGFAKNKSAPAGGLPAPLSLALDLFVKDPRLSMAVKWIAPMVLRYLPRLARLKGAAPEENSETQVSQPLKANIYGRLRRGVTALRGQLRKNNRSTTEHPEN